MILIFSHVDGSQLVTGTATQVYNAIGDLSAILIIMLTITGTATAPQIETIHTAISSGNLDASGMLEGSTSVVRAVVTNDVPSPDEDTFVEVTVTGDTDATKVIEISNLDVSTPFDGSGLASIDGTATQVAAALAALLRSW